MQVDQFESEVESLSLQAKKKKGDKEVSYISGVQTCHLSAKFAIFTLKWVIHVNRVDL